MPWSEIFLDYTGMVNQETIDHLLKALKKSKEFISLDKTTGKRVYAILVECLENISKHSVKNSSVDPGFLPFISAGKQKDKIVIKTGNPIHEDKTAKLVGKLNQINQMEEEALAVLYEKIINKEMKQDDNGAGLGFIIMKLKSGNKIDYSINMIDNSFYLFEMNISINKYTMRKLIIDKTASSPKVILDPDKNVFEISGESRPPDVGSFYGEILGWLDDYSLYLLKSQESNDPVVFNFDLEYFNSSSAKYILDFCKQMASVRSKGPSIEVRWQYEKDDTDMLEAGREMSRIAKLPFEFVKKENG
ncbi:MAG: DUF1987 domain-containing protein [Bacteroidetes bacterium]|nr:MAG: DUF1987 domain-containing protein [Bacteroidota bacterium]